MKKYSLPRLWTPRFYDAVNPETRSVGFHKAEPGWVSAQGETVQTDFDIWYAAAGCGEALVDGRWRAFEAGDLLVIKPGETYQQERADRRDPFQVYFAHVLPFGRGKAGLNAALARTWPRRMSLRHRPEFGELFERLFEAFTTQDRRRSLAVKGLTLQLLDVVFSELRRPRREPPPRAYANLLRAKEFIESEFQRDLRLADVAAQCGLSPSHLSALFTKHLGCPPMEYLLRVRLREAKLLLARGARVKEAAQATGFGSQHYLSRVFRRRVGMTPTEFARRCADER